MTQSIDLSGSWQFQPDPAGEGVENNWFQPQHDASGWSDVTVPASFDLCLPILERYEGHGWYRRTFDAPTGWRDRRVTLNFQGVNYHASVWINGQHVGDHGDGFLPFALPVNDALRFGETNTLIVRADNLPVKSEVPGAKCGWRPDGGIMREVSLVATDPLRIEHVSVVAEPTDGGGKLSVSAKIANDRDASADARLEVVLPHNNTTLTSATQSCSVGETVYFSANGEVAGVEAWSPKSPRLYDLRVALRVGDQVVDERTLRIGFRRIEVRDARLYLNGEPIFLTGYNRHEDTVEAGMCTDLKTARQDLLVMKDAGANFVRLAHYPHHPGELDLCDELGLLAMDEVPLYWWDGNAEGDEAYAEKCAIAERQLTTMIRRDVNHPSIIFWSVSNETQEQRPEVVEANTALLKHARSLDPTRLVTHASNHWQGQWAQCHEAQFAEDDVISLNGYPSVAKRGREKGYDLRESTKFWRRELVRLHGLYPDTPILVSEFGHPSAAGVEGGSFGADVQSQVIAHEFAGMDAPYVCGAAIWCWADHAWPGTGFCNNLRISPYGVVTRDRRALRGLQTASDLFNDSQMWRPDLPYRSLRMWRANLNDIPEAALPNGLRVVDYKSGDAGAWTQIHRETYAADPVDITDDLHARQFGEDDAVITQRQLFIETADGQKIATATAWYNDNSQPQRVGQVHWVAILPQWQGKGLAKPLLRAVLLRLRELGHDKTMLITQSTRVAAIRLYLAFGFRPESPSNKS